MRALCHLPGGLGRFIPGRIGANHSRLRHIGWEKCCHGLTCRPFQTSGEGFLSDLLSLLGYPSGSGAALLNGTLKLRYHTMPFARRKLSWKVPGRGGVADILTAGGEEIGILWGVSSGRCPFPSQKWKKGSGLTKKTPCPPVSVVQRGSVQPIPNVVFHDPGGDWEPGAGRRVARRIHGDSSLGDRLDRAGIG